MKKDKMAGMGIWQVCGGLWTYRVLWENLLEEDHWEELSIDGTIMLKLIF